MKDNEDRTCEQCGLIHKDGLSWHGRCYKCGGDLVPFRFEDHILVGVTPAGIQIYEKKD